MSSSDDDFDDDEDDVLLQDFLLGKTQIPEVSIISQTRNPLPAKIPQTQQPNTQIATLRAQLQQLQRQKQEEVSALKESLNTFKESSENQLSILKNAVQTLEDEKKFLNNELISKTASKKRKTEPSNKIATSTLANEEKYLPLRPLKEVKTGTNDSVVATQNETQGKPIQKVIKLSSDSSLLIDQLWNHSIVEAKEHHLNI
ncbi:DNA damage checkpoint family protein [Candida albicans]|uniref:DNA damage checkpoint family protein n=1 Tax=Candida albicans TaxID=5476 RepID=A0A8H6BUC6_CANAX|nr:DNA damage checkpoint family protein [Candida albicans]